MDQPTDDTQVSELDGKGWQARAGLWSWLLQVRALPPERR
jgi:hypothetical protein